MATANEILDKIAELETQLDEFDSAIAVGKNRFEVGGRQFTQKQLATEASKIKRQISQLKKIVGPYEKALGQVRDAETAVANAEAGLARAREIAASPITESPTGVSQSQIRADVRKAEQEVAKAKKSLEARRKSFAPQESKQYSLPAGVAAPTTAPAGRFATPRQFEEAGRPAPATTTPVQPTRTTGQPTTPAGRTTPTGTQPTTPGGRTTTPGGRGGRAAQTVVVDGERVKVGGDRWKEIIQEEFGSLWDVYNNNADVRKVIDRSVTEGWYNDAQKLSASLQNTNWFRTTESKARQFAIRQSTDPATLNDEITQKTAEIRQSALDVGVALSDATINKLATDSIKFGWTTDELSNAVGSEVVATSRAGGPQAMAELTRSTTGSTLRSFADQYAVRPSDSLIEEWTVKILTGKGSREEYENLIREQSRTLYRSLAPQIDKGLDVKTAVSAYTSQAKNILGVDETQIDWTQDKWNRALNYQDPKTGEYRQMDTWEWNRYLRSLPEWQETDDAKQLYRSAAFTLAQAFGRTT